MAAAAGAIIYVSSETGANDNAGTKDAPKKLLWKVMEELKGGERIHVAEGRQEGQSKSGVMPKIVVSNVVIMGGWAKDFSVRNPFKHLTIIEAPADAAGSTESVFYIGSQDTKAAEVTIDGFCIDRGPSNVYCTDGEPGANKRIEGHSDSSPWGYRELNRKQSGTNPVIACLGKGAFTIRNNLILNSPWWGIYVKGGGDGAITIENNLILSCQDVGIEAIPGGGWGKPTFFIRNNTVAFCTTQGGTRGRALSTQPDNGKDGCKYVIENNVLAFNDGAGIDTKFKGAKGDTMLVNQNCFYFNRLGDFAAADVGGAEVKDFDDELSVKNSGNVHECPKFITKMDKRWFDRWSIREYVDMCGTKFNPWAKLKAARDSLGFGEFEIPGYEPKKFADYKSLPQKRNNYNQSRYPAPMKKGEACKWEESALPLVGADGERGVKHMAQY